MFLEHRDRLEAEWIMRVSLRRAELVHRSILGASSTKTASKPAGNGLAGAPVEAISRSAVIGSGSQQLGVHQGGYLGTGVAAIKHSRSLGGGGCWRC